MPAAAVIVSRLRRRATRLAATVTADPAPRWPWPLTYPGVITIPGIVAVTGVVALIDRCPPGSDGPGEGRQGQAAAV
jgi:hypothetical protein